MNMKIVLDRNQDTMQTSFIEYTVVVAKGNYLEDLNKTDKRSYHGKTWKTTFEEIAVYQVVVTLVGYLPTSQ